MDYDGESNGYSMENDMEIGAMWATSGIKELKLSFNEME